MKSTNIASVTAPVKSRGAGLKVLRAKWARTNARNINERRTAKKFSRQYANTISSFIGICNGNYEAVGAFLISQGIVKSADSKLMYDVFMKLGAYEPAPSNVK